MTTALSPRSSPPRRRGRPAAIAALFVLALPTAAWGDDPVLGALDRIAAARVAAGTDPVVTPQSLAADWRADARSATLARAERLGERLEDAAADLGWADLALLGLEPSSAERSRVRLSAAAVLEAAGRAVAASDAAVRGADERNAAAPGAVDAGEIERALVRAESLAPLRAARAAAALAGAAEAGDGASRRAAVLAIGLARNASRPSAWAGVEAELVEGLAARLAGLDGEPARDALGSAVAEARAAAGDLGPIGPRLLAQAATARVLVAEDQAAAARELERLLDGPDLAGAGPGARVAGEVVLGRLRLAGASTEGAVRRELVRSADRIGAIGAGSGMTSRGLRALAAAGPGGAVELWPASVVIAAAASETGPDGAVDDALRRVIDAEPASAAGREAAWLLASRLESAGDAEPAAAVLAALAERELAAGRTEPGPRSSAVALVTAHGLTADPELEERLERLADAWPETFPERGRLRENLQRRLFMRQMAVLHGTHADERAFNEAVRAVALEVLAIADRVRTSGDIASAKNPEWLEAAVVRNTLMTMRPALDVRGDEVADLWAGPFGETIDRVARENAPEPGNQWHRENMVSAWLGVALASASRSAAEGRIGAGSAAAVEAIARAVGTGRPRANWASDVERLLALWDRAWGAAAGVDPALAEWYPAAGAGGAEVGAGEGPASAGARRAARASAALALGLLRSSEVAAGEGRRAEMHRTDRAGLRARSARPLMEAAGRLIAGGEFAAARAVYAEAERAGLDELRTGFHRGARSPADLDVVRGEALLEAGDEAEAFAAFRTAAERAGEQTAAFWHVWARMAELRAARANSGDAAELDDLRAAIDRLRTIRWWGMWPRATAALERIDARLGRGSTNR